MDGTTETREGDPLRSVAVAIGLTILGFVGAEIMTLPAILADPTLLEAPAEAPIETRTAFMILNFVGMAAVGGLYLAITGRGWSYVDLRVPTVRDWLYVGVGVGASLALYVAAVVVITVLELPAADNQIVVFIGDDTTMILVMIAIAFLFNAPAEEFLFRNVIQKRLYDAFSRMGAVVGASLIFAAVHLPVFAALADTALAAVVPVAIVFGGGLIFGYVYAKTDNLVVPTLAHAAYNSFIFGLLYISMVYDVAEPEPTPGLVVDAIAALPL